MKLYLISQDTNSGYDTYDSAVVAAPNEATARDMYPHNGESISGPDAHWRVSNDWVTDPALVTVKHIGTAIKGTAQGVICASFNAG